MPRYNVEHSGMKIEHRFHFGDKGFCQINYENGIVTAEDDEGFYVRFRHDVHSTKTEDEIITELALFVGVHMARLDVLEKLHKEIRKTKIIGYGAPLAGMYGEIPKETEHMGD